MPPTTRRSSSRRTVAYAAGTPWIPRTVDAKVVEPPARPPVRPPVRTLAGLLAEGPMPLADARRLGEGIARALARRHASGTIVGDLTPTRVRLVEREGTDGVELVDPERASGGHTSEPPAARYMAPEQVQSHSVSAAADVYTLGVILFEMVAGQAPIEGRTPMEQMVRKTIQDAPPLSSVCPGVSPSYAVLVDACLAREPMCRPSSAAEVAARLVEDARPRATVELSARHARGSTTVAPARPRDRHNSEIAVLAVAMGVAVAAVAYAFMDDDTDSPWHDRTRGNLMAPLDP